MKKSMCIFSITLFIILFGCAFHQGRSDDLLTRDQDAKGL